MLKSSLLSYASGKLSGALVIANTKVDQDMDGVDEVSQLW